jgi:hypothetical protein
MEKTTLKRGNKDKETRRYKTGEHFLYDKEFEVLERRSPILNLKAQEKVFAPVEDLNWLMSTYEVKDTDLLIVEKTLNGVFDESGKLMQSGIRLPIKMIEQQRLNRGETLKQAKAEAINQYYSEKALKLEAQIDIIKLELKELKKLIEAAEQKREDARKPFLPRGPRGSKTGVHPLCLVDGQRIERDNKTGELYICDKRSPYNGMSMSDYREMAHNFIVSLSRRTANVPKSDWPKIPEGVKLIDK